MTHKTKNKKDNNEQQQFDFCEVCRLNHNQGRRHNYFPSHKTALSTLLTRFQSKLSDVKFFLKTPTPICPEHAHQNRLWCIFCNCDILSLDGPFARGNEIQHLASLEHWKRVKGFMWKYGGGMDRVDLFRIGEVDYAKWEKKCRTLKTETEKTESISYTNERTQASCSVPSVSQAGPSHNMHGSIQVQYPQYATGYMDNHHCSKSVAMECSSYGYLSNGSNASTGVMNMTQISPTSKENLEGNVHSGAPPPWFDTTSQNQLDSAFKAEQDDLVASKARKSSKLNPKRVGAAWAEKRKLELELERRGGLVNNNYDAKWLPNFGRVWQSGTRKESRKEFQTENKASAQADNQMEILMPLQPYVSKRMRRETN
ncbi:hypothetical protein OROMI_007771 [Orobanche minor]